MNRLSMLLLALNAVLVAVVVYVVFIKSASQQIYYVDSAKLLKEYKEMAAARKEYETKAGGWKANVDTLTAGLTARAH